MTIITGSRGSGKTEALIRYAHKNSALILCPTVAECRFIKKRATEQGLSILDPMKFEDYFFGRGRGIFLDVRQPEIVIDELPRCLQMCFKANISLATGTMPTMHPQDYINLNAFVNYNNEHPESLNQYVGIWE